MTAELPLEVEYADENPLAMACPELERIRREGSIPDMTIRVAEGKTVQAHRIIIAARIRHLKKRMCNKASDSNLIQEWPTHTYEAVDPVIRYVYTGKIKINYKTVFAIYIFSHTMDYGHIKDLCSTFLIDRLETSNLKQIWDFAKLANNHALIEPCMEIMRENFEMFIGSELMIQLSEEIFENIVNSEELKVTCEESVVAGILSWITMSSVDEDASVREKIKKLLLDYKPGENKPENRLNSMHSLMANVRWGLTSQEFCEFVDDRVRLRFKQHKLSELFPKWKGPNIFENTMRTTHCLLILRNKENGFSWFSNGAEKPMEEHPINLGRRENFTTTAVGDKVYFIGGEEAGKATSAVTCLDPRKNEMMECCQMKYPRYFHSSVAIDDEIFVCDGRDRSQYQKDCEIYNTKDNCWRTLKELPGKRNGLALVGVPNRRVFAMGGEESSFSCLNNVIYYNISRSNEPALAEWQEAAPMLQGRSNFAAAYFKGMILVTGGENLKGGTELFTLPDQRNPLGQWMKIETTVVIKSTFSFVTLPQCIYAFGTNDEIMCFASPNGKTDTPLTEWTWEWITKPNFPGSFCGAAKIPKKVFFSEN